MKYFNHLFGHVVFAVILYCVTAVVLWLLPLDQWWDKVTPWNVIGVLAWAWLLPECAIALERHRMVIETFLSQEIVDNKLSKLAKEFDQACNCQVRLQGEGSWSFSLRVAREMAENAKKAFWDAHALAKSFGFAVLGKYSQYLS